MSKKHPDTKRLETLLESLEWDGYAYWLPEWCVKENNGTTFTPEPSLEELRKVLDERKPSS